MKTEKKEQTIVKSMRIPLSMDTLICKIAKKRKRSYNYVVNELLNKSFE